MICKSGYSADSKSEEELKKMENKMNKKKVENPKDMVTTIKVSDEMAFNPEEIADMCTPDTPFVYTRGVKDYKKCVYIFVHKRLIKKAELLGYSIIRRFKKCKGRHYCYMESKVNDIGDIRDIFKHVHNHRWPIDCKEIEVEIHQIRF